MQYYQNLQRLFAMNLNSEEKFDLKNIQALADIFGFPERQFQTVHIAGSNGKGSVTTKIAVALQATGLRVGLYTSPHLATFRERIRINGEMISKEALTTLSNEIFTIIDKHSLPATFFEITTILAFLYFARQKVDIATIETGLGGRLDATNIINPILTTITSISLDHCDILGNTKESIALEKAGIIKSGCPIVIGPRAMPEILKPLAKLSDSPVFYVQGHFDDFDSENNAIARCCLEQLGVPSKAIEQGLSVRPPCRLEKINPSCLQTEKSPAAIILDVAHNPDGLEHLFKALLRDYPTKSFRIIFGLSKNKDMRSCIDILVKYGRSFHPIAAKDWHVHSVEQLDSALADAGVTSMDRFLLPCLEENVSDAFHLAAAKDEVLVVCGSFYIMAAVKACFGIVEERDFS